MKKAIDRNFTAHDSFGPNIANKRIAEPKNCNAEDNLMDQDTPRGVLSAQDATKKVGIPTRILLLN